MAKPTAALSSRLNVRENDEKSEKTFLNWGNTSMYFSLKIKYRVIQLDLFIQLEVTACHWKGSLFHHPKKATKNCQVLDILHARCGKQQRFEWFGSRCGIVTLERQFWAWHVGISYAGYATWTQHKPTLPNKPHLHLQDRLQISNAWPVSRWKGRRCPSNVESHRDRPVPVLRLSIMEGCCPPSSVTTGMWAGELQLPIAEVQNNSSDARAFV